MKIGDVVLIILILLGGVLGTIAMFWHPLAFLGLVGLPSKTQGHLLLTSFLVTVTLAGGVAAVRFLLDDF